MEAYYREFRGFVMGIKELKDEIVDEVGTILASNFRIDVTKTDTVPHSSDAAITFPNLDAKRQGAKLIDTCVLYIDIRRSTELNFTHKPITVARLYSAFVRAMTRCARYHKGHIRGIIGDRVMVIFDRQNAFVYAVECALSMNSVAQYVINKYFTRGEVTCGIGIDAGKMLATKTGVRRRGIEQANYRNLVWLGRPANIASKLTDLANKPEDSFKYTVVRAAFNQSVFGLGQLLWPTLAGSGQRQWREIYANDFVRQLSSEPGSNRIVHSDPSFASMSHEERTFVRRPKTGPILMTEAVWIGYRTAAPQAPAVANGWFKEITLSVPSYSGKVYSGDVHYKAFEA